MISSLYLLESKIKLTSELVNFVDRKGPTVSEFYHLGIKMPVIERQTTAPLAIQ